MVKIFYYYKFLIFFVFLCLNFHQAFSQGWTTVSPSNYARLESACVEVDGKIYVFSGFHNFWNLARQTEVYDPETDKWTVLSNMPLSRTHQAFATDGHLVYLAGGWTAKIHQTNVMIYNTKTDKWSTGPSLPKPTSSVFMVRLGRKLHLFGGLQVDMATDTDDHFVLDLDNQSKGWVAAAPMPVARNHHSGAVVNGIIYSIGGQQGHDGPVTYLKDVHAYDAYTDTWKKVADLPTVRSHYEPGTTVYDGKIIIVGGRARNNINNITEYDPEKDKWTELAPLPGNILAPNAKVVGNYLIVANGSTSEPLKVTRIRPITRASKDKISFWPKTINYSTSNEKPFNGTVYLSTHNNETNFTVNGETGANWLKILSNSGKADRYGAEVKLGLDVQNLPDGQYTTTITATAEGYEPASLTITVNVTNGNVANQPPVVDAGDDKTVVLPNNSLTLTGTATDPDGEIASVLWTKQSGPDVTMENEDTNTVKLTNLQQGSYVFRFTATDDKNATAYDEVTVTVKPQVISIPPTIAIYSPSPQQAFNVGEEINIQVEASDEEGEIARVEYFSGTNKIGETTEHPFSLKWSNATPGTHTLTAKATNDKGISATSAEVEIVVNAESNQVSVQLLTPYAGETFVQDDEILISAEVNGEDGSVEKVEFFQGDIKLGEAGSEPYQFLWTNAEPGEYQITAKAITAGGSSTSSGKITISVISITACPSAGALLREYWLNIEGEAISAIPVGQAPAGSSELTSFEAPENFNNNYGTRLSGYVCPPLSGAYTFWINSSHNSELWISSNENPSNKTRIAYSGGGASPGEWESHESQKSSPITLVAGQLYYIEAIHQSTNGNDHLAVGWQWPGGRMERPIPGERLVKYDGETITNVQEKEFLPLFNIYPVPTNNKFFIELLTYNKEGAVIELISAQGRVLRRIYSGSTGTGVKQKFEVDSSGLPAGIYLVRLSNGSNHVVKRVIIEK